MRFRQAVGWLSLAIVFLCVARSAFGQGSDLAIRGTVTDAAGTAITGARVAITDDLTKTECGATTNARLLRNIRPQVRKVRGDRSWLLSRSGRCAGLVRPTTLRQSVLTWGDGKWR